MYRKIAQLVTCATIGLITGCTRTVVVPAPSVPATPPAQVLGAAPPPQSGVANYIWEEPMVDVVDVPPGLDPEGHYYRPAHQEVIEIRQGRWKYYEQDGQE